VKSKKAQEYLNDRWLEMAEKETKGKFNIK